MNQHIPTAARVRLIAHDAEQQQQQQLKYSRHTSDEVQQTPSGLSVLHLANFCFRGFSTDPLMMVMSSQFDFWFLAGTIILVLNQPKLN